ncbi:transcription-repair coupling factor, partial [bacterium]|nr:transcription-repair coupling factor [bacterium]
LIIEYKGGDKLYIPVEKIELISKYSTNDNLEPKINKLGGNEWNKTKLKVKQKLENIAGELLKLYALRESSKGFSFRKDDQDQIDFENSFIYEDTVDQRKVTEEIKKDMEKEKPMDRLLCGDVGYGKTEIAFRAMFKAVMSNKQVAYLCPTTILSNQHYTNALERFKEYAVNIACLNRFVSQKETKKIIEGLKTGKIDIVIGTHRLLSDDIIFKDLGLLVVDEEQRFGVKHKEKIKQLKNNVDVLTLSATPIPRTLQMSMVGIRDLSLLETPPVNRYPIQTYVLEENSQIIKDAIYKELSRDGQVFILYNHVSDLENMASQVSKLVPEAKITFAHGQMTKTELENVMMSFINKEYNVLLCTTIIETGIDIPTVNTLIIIDADRFGLSQLYQIRGRVGRGNLIAYCYLMYKKGKVLSDIAEKRLSVIKEFTELGSGFAIAMRDLSIRGAGDILGSEQAGFIDSIGIELYLKMLDDEIKKLKGLPVPEEKTDEQPLINVATSISDDYVEETDLKIEIHKKINEINSYEMLNKIKLELEDRFGKLNDEMLIYMYEELFENKAKQIGITKVRQTNNFIELTLSKELTNQVDGQQLFLETSKLSRMFRFKMILGCLVVTLDIVKLEKHYIYYLLDFIKILEQSKK